MKIICFAYSVKQNKYCFAGKEFETNKWIRPVLNATGDGIDNLSTGLIEKPAILDIFDVTLKGKVALNHQQENCLFEHGKWKKVGTADKSNIRKYLDSDVGTLWINGFSSSLGLNNRYPIKYMSGFNYSLLLIEVEELYIIKRRNINNLNKLYGEFKYKGATYILNITGELEVNVYKTLPENMKCRYMQSYKKILCISAAQPYDDGNVYKLIASITTI